MFNFMTLDDLTEVLKRNTVSKEVKSLAIRRYLDSDSKAKRDGGDSEAYLHLVSYTSFFSDKY